MLDVEPATRTLGRLVEGVTDDQLDGPTPCADTSLAALLDHVDGLAIAFAMAAGKIGGDEGPSADAGRLGDDWRPRIRQRLDELAAAWLLTFTFGFGFDLAMGASPEPWPVVAAAAEAHLAALGPPAPGEQPDPETWIARLGSLPLLAQPGERWLYNTGAQVLGVVAARATGTPFADALGERVLGPLGMATRRSGRATARVWPPPMRRARRASRSWIRRTDSGDGRRPSPTEPPASSPRPTTCWPSPGCCSAAATRSSPPSRWRP